MTMNEIALILSQGFLEAIAIIMIATMININIKLHMTKLLIYGVIVMFFSLIWAIYFIPFHLVLSILVYILVFLLIRQPQRASIIGYIIDMLLSIGLLIVVQLLISGIASIFNMDLINANRLTTVFLLIAIIAIFALLSINTKVHIFFEKYYIPYRTTIAFSIISLLFLVIIIADLAFRSADTFATEGGAQFFVVLIGYFVINIILFISLFRARRASEKSNAMTKYGDYLQNVIDQYRALIHDHKNHLHMVQTLNQNKDGSSRNNELDKYLEGLIGEQNRKTDTSIVKDDVFISAILFQKQTIADQKGIRFSVDIAASLSAYMIPQAELIDIIANLIDNAFEEVEELEAEKRIVQISFSERLIVVGNKVSSRTRQSGTDSFFTKGFSTKGRERGYGLSNVAMLADRYGIGINCELSGDYLEFRLEFKDE